MADVLLTATGVQWQLLRIGQLSVTQTQVHVFTALYWALLILDALIGVLVLRGRWRKATTPARAESAADTSLVAPDGKRR